MASREVANENFDNILHIARRLGPLRERAVFVGGSITALLVSDPASPDNRATKDVDVFVRVTSLKETTQLEENLREIGFRNCTDEGAPVCRWVINDCTIDVMPIGTSANAYIDRWSVPAIEHAVELELEPGLSIRHVTAPCFIALKLETFSDRGEGNYRDSADIEDIIHVVDGRFELADEIRAAEHDLQEHLAMEFRKMLENDDFLESIPAHLPADAASQAREPIILERMKRIADLPEPMDRK